MSSFVRGLLGRADDDLSDLKPWAKAVFILYTIIVVPLIALLLFLVFRAFPAILATGLDSASKLVDSAQMGMARGDWVAPAAAVLQLAILALQVVGLGMVIVGVIRRVFIGLWRWGSGSSQKRATSAFASALLLVGLAFLWTPVLPGGGSGPLAAYATSSFVPIPDTARGVIGDAIPALQAVLPQALLDLAPMTSPQPSTAPTESPSPSPSPDASISPSPSAAPSGSPTVPPATPSASAPTPSPSASASSGIP
jgi:hypothetical protein